MSRRLISHTEITAMLECPAKHAFGYTGHLTGGMALSPKVVGIRLRQGRAWGRGVAEFHQADPELTVTARYGLGLMAINESLDEDAQQMREHGVYVEAEHHDLQLKLADLLWDYALRAEPMQISDPEFELLLPIPSRSGRGVSNRYFFQGFLDGIVTEDRQLWLAEYKMRDSLSAYEDIVAMPQIRRYAWAAERQFGIRLAGAIVDERLSITPKPARWVTAKRKGEGLAPFNEKGYGRLPSHAVDQLTTGALYVEACLEAGVDINEDTVRALDARKWQARHRVIFKRSEIEEAGRELVSAAHQIQLLDTRALFPVRNRAPWRCRGCWFNEVCDRAGDRELIETNFELVRPKRDREPLEAAIA